MKEKNKKVVDAIYQQLDNDMIPTRLIYEYEKVYVLFMCAKCYAPFKTFIAGIYFTKELGERKIEELKKGAENNPDDWEKEFIYALVEYRVNKKGELKFNYEEMGNE